MPEARARKYRLGSVVSTSDGNGQYLGAGFGFAGYRYDAETGLYYVRNRYYDPRLGRWLQPDPIGQDGGVNLYAYVGNDPLNLTDPLGLRTLELGGSINLSFLGFGALSFNGGLALDDRGNVGFYGTSSAGFALGGAKLGLSIGVSNAETINDLAGPSRAYSVAASGGGLIASVDISEARDAQNRQLVTSGVTVGVGGGYGYSNQLTYTGVKPLVQNSPPPYQNSSSSVPAGDQASYAGGGQKLK